MNRRHISRMIQGYDARFFFFNDTPTTEIYALPLHDALPIWQTPKEAKMGLADILTGMMNGPRGQRQPSSGGGGRGRTAEHTSELQSQANILCRPLLRKKKQPLRQYLALSTYQSAQRSVVPRA